MISLQDIECCIDLIVSRSGKIALSQLLYTGVCLTKVNVHVNEYNSGRRDSVGFEASVLISFLLGFIQIIMTSAHKIILLLQ